VRQRTLAIGAGQGLRGAVWVRRPLAVVPMAQRPAEASVIRFQRFAVTRTLRPSTITMLTIPMGPRPARLQSP